MATCAQGNFVIAQVEKRAARKRLTIPTETCLQDYYDRQGERSLWVFSLAALNLWKSCRPFIRFSRGNEGSCSGVHPRELCSISGPVIRITVSKYWKCVIGTLLKWKLSLLCVEWIPATYWYEITQILLEGFDKRNVNHRLSMRRACSYTDLPQ